MSEGHVFAMPHDMIDLALRTTKLASEFAERRESLSNRMAGFLDGGWTGGAGAMFKEAFALFDKGAEDVQTGLDLLGENVSDGARQYQAQDQVNQHAFMIENTSSSGGGGSAEGIVMNW